MAKKIVKSTSIDKNVLNLIEEVKRRKSDIAKAERESFKTNCQFSYTDGKNPDTINIHVESSVKNLICIAAFLREAESSYSSAAFNLGVDAPPFTWSGFKVSDWLEDIKIRINKIQISNMRRGLEVLEARLNAIISDDLRTRMELDAITQELDKYNK